MILTEKCLQDYKIWFDKNYNDYWRYYQTKQSILNALIVDFLDSVGIYIISDYFELNKGFYSEILNENFEIVKPTRQEALTEAIKKANEIYNEKYSISQ